MGFFQIGSGAVQYEYGRFCGVTGSAVVQPCSGDIGMLAAWGMGFFDPTDREGSKSSAQRRKQPDSGSK